MSTARRGGALVAAVLLAACGTGDPMGVTDGSAELDRDVALAAADAAADDVELMGGPGGPLGLGLAGPTAGALHAPLHCTDRDRGGITVTRSCIFRDAAGNEQPAYDPETTATAEIHAEIHGSISRAHWEASIDRERELVVSGLEGAETTRTWNGVGMGAISRSRHRDGGATRTYDMTFVTTIEDVVVPVPRSDDSWPVSGTITREVRVEISGGPRDGTVVERVVTVTFNGTPLVPVTVNGVTRTFDLRTRRFSDPA